MITNLPVYPHFRPLELTDAAVFDKAFREYPPTISEFTFTNLYAWRRAYGFSVSLLEDNLIIVSESKGKKKFLLPIGPGVKKSLIEKIMTGAGVIFFRLPEETAKLFEGNLRFSIQEDRDNFDYIYKNADLITLAGKKFDGKRNLIKKFESTYSYEYIQLDADNVHLCLDFEEAWCTAKNCEAILGLSQERLAIRDMVEHFSLFGLTGAAIKVANRISAVCLAQKLNQETLVMHVLKAETQMTGLYQFMLHEFLIREAKDFRFVNLEQDLGIPGLRKAKLSYQPSSMAKKFILEFSQK